MKLTKGRLSKLYRKTNQSKRRFKKNKKRPVLRNTFRKRRPFDLNRKTLKRLRGGQVKTEKELQQQKKELIDANDNAVEKYKKDLTSAENAKQEGQMNSLSAAENVREKQHTAEIGEIDKELANFNVGATVVKEVKNEEAETLEAETLEAAKLAAAKLAAEKEKTDEEATKLAAEKEKTDEEATKLAAEKEKTDEEATKLAAEKEKTDGEEVKRLEAEKKKAEEEAARVNEITVGESTQNTAVPIAKGYPVGDTNDNEIISAVNVQEGPIKDTNQTTEIEKIQKEYTQRIEEAGRELTKKLLAIAANKVTNVGKQDSMAATTAVANTIGNTNLSGNTISNGNSQTPFEEPSAPLKI